jgi:hypothetical protein
MDDYVPCVAFESDKWDRMYCEAPAAFFYEGWWTATGPIRTMYVSRCLTHRYYFLPNGATTISKEEYIISLIMNE